MEMLDPNVAFQEQQTTIAAQKRLAEILRKKAAANPLPDGQMVSGYYVAPNALEYMASTAMDQQAMNAENQVAQQEADYGRSVDQAGKQWQSNFPKAIPAVPEQQGPVDPMNPGELDAQAAQPVTSAQHLKYALEGARIPGMEKQAQMYNTTSQADLAREDTQVARSEQLKETLKARAEEQVKALQEQARQFDLRLEDRALDRAQRERLEGLSNQTKLQIAQLMAQMKKGTDDVMKGTEIRLDVENLSRRMEPHAPLIDSAQQIQDMIDSYRDPKTGKVRNIPGIGLGQGMLATGLLSTEASTNQQKMQMFVNAMVRAQAGLSQTLSESEKALKEAMSTGSVRQEQWEAAWPGLMSKVNASSRNIASGYDPKVVEIYNSRNPNTLRQITSKTPQATWTIEETK